MDEDCLGLVVRRPGGAATLFYVCVKMSHIGNGTSHMNSDPDTNRMLINRLHTGREGKR